MNTKLFYFAIKTIILSLSLLHILPTHSNTLIIIRGTANSGKSTLCKQLCSLNNSYKFVSQDEINRNKVYEICSYIFPENMKLISDTIKHENMWQAIKTLNTTFLNTTTQEDQQLAINAINEIRAFFDDPIREKQLIASKALTTKHVMQQLIFHAACGHDVIFDSWGVTNWENEIIELQKCFDHVINVVTYCPLEIVQQRWECRNNIALETKIYTDKRFFIQMIKSFFGFLVPVENLECACTTVTKDDFDLLVKKGLEYALDDAPNVYMSEKQFSFRECTKQELLNFKEEIYEKYGFNDKSEVFLAPSSGYDILLCTQGDCKEYASDLWNRINEHIEQQVNSSCELKSSQCTHMT